MAIASRGRSGERGGCLPRQRRAGTVQHLLQARRGGTLALRHVEDRAWLRWSGRPFWHPRLRAIQDLFQAGRGGAGAFVAIELLRKLIRLLVSQDMLHKVGIRAPVVAPESLGIIAAGLVEEIAEIAEPRTRTHLRIGAGVSGVCPEPSPVAFVT